MPGTLTTILLVDDRRENLFVLQKILAEYLPNCETSTATSAEEGLALIAMRSFDGALIDMQMPGMDGIEMCRRLKRHPQSAVIPVILITAHHSTAELRARGLEAGADDFIERPIDNAELIARIRTILRMKHAEDRLRAGKAELERQVAQQTVTLREYRKAVESSHDLIAIVDRQFRYSMVNAAWLRQQGLNRDAVIGHSICEIFGDETFEKLKPRLERCLRGETLLFEQPFDLLTQGRRFIQLRLSPITADDGNIEGIVIIRRDVTLERESERLKDEFIATAAHELNTPLTVIRGYAELLHDEPTEKPFAQDERRRFLGSIIEKTECLQKLVDDMLGLSLDISGQKPALNKTLWPIGAELAKQIRHFQRLPGQCRFEIRCDDPDLEIFADQNKIGQVLENLLGNAIRYSPQGGLITLISIKESDSLRVSVCDEGIGMTSEQRERAFKKFYRADTRENAVSGLGLGLAIAHNIVEAHGGRIWLESEPAKGTCSHFTLPL
jgi:PAS domain S-box-containing protein